MTQIWFIFSLQVYIPQAINLILTATSKFNFKNNLIHTSITVHYSWNFSQGFIFSVFFASNHKTTKIYIAYWIFSIIQAEIPFTNNMQEPVVFVCWEESIMYNAEETSHSASAFVAKETVYQSWASAWCSSVTHFALGLRSVCQRNFCLDYNKRVRGIDIFQKEEYIRG